MAKASRSTRRPDESRADLAGEHALGDLGQLILFIIFLIVWLTDIFWLHFSTPWANGLPWFLNIPLAVIILVLAGVLAQQGLKIVFEEIRVPPVVIRAGVFNLVRHPIYLGAILVYAGLLILAFSLAATVVWLIIMVFYHFIAKYEEKILLARFGADYAQYQQDVPMWLPLKVFFSQAPRRKQKVAARKTHS
ncbi:isoprenylcysteine carboxylmethyltransferase family protein [candidate division KSB1 bacterium]|nr:isoprenylcysteine carboxylmethyltransferase family protein [candidate division KSB1 bacterium]